MLKMTCGIDLHIHTTNSDGCDTPEEIIQLVKEAKKEADLAVIAITDHNVITMLSRKAFYDAQKNDVIIIPGVEICVNCEGKILHILGYGMDFFNVELDLLLKKNTNFFRDYFLSSIKKINDILENSGKKRVDEKRYANLNPNYYLMTGLGNYLFEEGAVQSAIEGVNLVFDNINIPVSPVRVEEAISAVHKAEGAAVLAHPFAPRQSLKRIANNQKDAEDLIRYFAAHGIDGIECYHPGHNAKDINFGEKIAKDFGLFKTSGSDWHGSMDKIGKGILNFMPNYLSQFGDQMNCK